VPSCHGAPSVLGSNRIHLVLFGMQNRTMSPYLAATVRQLCWDPMLPGFGPWRIGSCQSIICPACRRWCRCRMDVASLAPPVQHAAGVSQIDGASLTPEAFEELYDRRGRPVVMAGLLQGWAGACVSVRPSVYLSVRPSACLPA
jgi:hypothetical protein